MVTEKTEPVSPVRTIALVAGVALFAGIMITGAWEFSHERILENERARLLNSLMSVVGFAGDDAPIAVELEPPAAESNASIEQLYAMVGGNGLVAWVYVVNAPQGYNGPITLLTGIRPDGRISAVRVVQHRETPGLGDAIETRKSDWIRQFTGRSRSDPPNWALKVDGGSFDAITGATVTPRAVVAAIAAVLDYHADHETRLEEALVTAAGERSE